MWFYDRLQPLLLLFPPPPSAASRAVINGHRLRWGEIALNTLLIASEWLRHPLDATYALDALINKWLSDIRLCRALEGLFAYRININRAPAKTNDIEFNAQLCVSVSKGLFSTPCPRLLTWSNSAAFYLCIRHSHKNTDNIINSSSLNVLKWK